MPQIPERHTYKERDKNPINRIINKMLDKVTEKEINKYISRYAVDAQGNVDAPLAQRIRFEVLRRSAMGREIDVLEPLRATLYMSAIGLGTGTAAKAVEQRKSDAKSLKTFLRATSLASFAAAIVTIGRILSFARFKAGLYAGAQTALTLHQYDQQSGFTSGLMQTTKTIKTPDMPHKKETTWNARMEADKASSMQERMR